MDPGFWIAAGSLLLATILAFLKIREWLRDKKLAETVEHDQKGMLPLQIAQGAVQILQQTLNTVNGTLAIANEEAFNLRRRVGEQDRIISDQAHTIGELTARLDNMQKRLDEQDVLIEQLRGHANL